MRLTLDENWTATTTGKPLRVTPRFSFRDFSVRIAPYTDADERTRYLTGTFGSTAWLWDTPDELRFDLVDRELVGAEFHIVGEAADPEDAARVPTRPLVRSGGLRAEEVRGFRLETTTELCRSPGDSVFTCLRDLDVLDEPPAARIGIAPGVALLVQHGAVVGWDLTDPVKYLTSGFAAPDPAPPVPATRHLFTECMDIITTSLFDEVRARNPAALAGLRTVRRNLRDQQQDLHRVGALATASRAADQSSDGRGTPGVADETTARP
ncbi:hypothetical protein [Streptomyces erythrochromogenes]|uniref:hypothetical protein n=1 Tax=Streptomyces erythrochromogenes TaxID=285574 RepID=UPI003692A955